VGKTGTREGLARRRAFDELRRRLIEGQWPPATVLQEQDLADELELSKTPVREALQTLSVRHLVRPVPRLGYVVSSIELEDLAEVFGFRALLESELVATAASRGAVLKPAAAESAEGAMWQVEWNFHSQLAQAGGGPRIRRTVEELLDEASRAMHYLSFPPEILRALVDDHQALLEAIAARDVVLARALVTIHLTRMRESLMASLRQKLRDQNLLA
jgi:DNA-binding GntR family transcriptional regulator